MKSIERQLNLLGYFVAARGRPVNGTEAMASIAAYASASRSMFDDDIVGLREAGVAIEGRRGHGYVLVGAEARGEGKLALAISVAVFIGTHRDATVSEVAEAFGVQAAEVREALDSLLMCGFPPYLPDDYVNVNVGADGRIEANNAERFARVIRLRPLAVAA